jgi:hypothetical protein
MQRNRGVPLMKIKGASKAASRFQTSSATPSRIMHCRNPFPLPDHLATTPQPLLSLWQSLKRGEAGMPFADDLGVPALSTKP